MLGAGGRIFPKFLSSDNRFICVEYFLWVFRGSFCRYSSGSLDVAVNSVTATAVCSVRFFLLLLHGIGVDVLWWETLKYPKR